MRPGDIVREAIAALTAHRLQAALSSIGIIAGVAAVVAAFAIGEGARREAFEEIGSLGITNVFVRAAHAESLPPLRRKTAAPALTLADARAIASAIPAAIAVAATRSTRTRAVADGRAAELTLAGVTSNWRQVAEPHLLAGRWLSNQDAIERRRVAVIGREVARELLGRADPIGARIRAAGGWYVVVGVRRSAGGIATRRFNVSTSPICWCRFPRWMSRSATTRSIASRDRGAGGQRGRVETTRQTAVLGSRHHGAASYELVVPRELLRAPAQRALAPCCSGSARSRCSSAASASNIMLASGRAHARIGVRRAFARRAA